LWSHNGMMAQPIPVFSGLCKINKLQPRGNSKIRFGLARTVPESWRLTTEKHFPIHKYLKFSSTLWHCWLVTRRASGWTQSNNKRGSRQCFHNYGSYSSSKTVLLYIFIPTQLQNKLLESLLTVHKKSQMRLTDTKHARKCATLQLKWICLWWPSCADNRANTQLT